MTPYEPAQASLLTKGAVHKLAESVASQVGWQPGDNIHEIISNLGGSVEIEDTLLTDPEQTGSLYVDGPNRFKIIVPSHTSPERDRFTIAHEFGHFVLHYLLQKQKNPNYPERVIAYRQGSKRIEWEANWFAGAFLMPENQYRQTFDEKNGDIWAIADRFRVSTKAAEVRAKDLGLIDA
jgi:Zn-dependent peptidase ImmA (M78 family)